MLPVENYVSDLYDFRDNAKTFRDDIDAYEAETLAGLSGLRESVETLTNTVKNLHSKGKVNATSYESYGIIRGKVSLRRRKRHFDEKLH